MIRATRLLARLGWEMDEKTLARFRNAKEEGMISTLSPFHRGYELQEIGHEEDGLKILKVLEAEGWMKVLFPAWTSAAADVPALEQLRELQGQLQMQGVNPDTSAAQMQLLTAKLPEKDVTALKHLFVRPGFVKEWESLEAGAKEFAKVLTGKQASLPSEVWKLFTTSNAEAILWLGLTSKSAAVQAKYNNFFSVWPEARQKIPYLLLQEMRITPELPGYQDLLKQIFLQLIDDGLETEEKMRAFLGPFSPPAPPPPVTIRRARGKKAAGARARAEIEDDDDEDAPARRSLSDRDDEKDEKGDSEEDDSLEIRPLDIAPIEIPLEAPLAPVAPASPVVDAAPAERPTRKSASKQPPSATAPAQVKPAPEARPAKAVPPARPPVVAAAKAPAAAKPVPPSPAPSTAAKKADPAPAKPHVKPAAKSAPKPAPSRQPAKKAVAKPAGKAAKSSAASKSVPAKKASNKNAAPATAPARKSVAAKPKGKAAPPKPKSAPAKKKAAIANKKR